MTFIKNICIFNKNDSFLPNKKFFVLYQAKHHFHITSKVLGYSYKNQHRHTFAFYPELWDYTNKLEPKRFFNGFIPQKFFLFKEFFFRLAILLFYVFPNSIKIRLFYTHRLLKITYPILLKFSSYFYLLIIILNWTIFLADYSACLLYFCVFFGAWQTLPQWLQSPPQLDLPARLSFTIPRMTKPTTAITTSNIKNVPKFISTTSLQGNIYCICKPYKPMV